MSDVRVTCDLCAAIVPPHAHYVVRIDVFADPSIPPLSSDDEALGDEGIQQLFEQMKLLSADDLQDDVHRRFEYRLCRVCQRQFLANPLGLPRAKRAGTN